MFDKTRRVLDLCRTHLEDTGTSGTEIESVVVGFALTVVHAEFEMAVKSAIRERCQVSTDPLVRNFTSQAADRLVRSIKVSDLRGILGYFDDTCKTTFNHSIDSTKSESFYTSLESNRQALAHNSTHNATMSDVQQWFPEAQTVLVRFREALGLNS